MARFVLITWKERKALEFQAKGGDKNACLPWQWVIGRNILLDLVVLFVIDWGLCIKWDKRN
ncbi:MAG: hypothetical protein ACREOW_07655 [Thermodesulfobacteriota bacterium]